MGARAGRLPPNFEAGDVQAGDVQAGNRRRRRMQDEAEPTKMQQVGANNAYKLFMVRYAELGPEGIRAEFAKEIEPYKNPKFEHTAFDANPAKNRNKDLLTCLDDTRVKLSDDVYINASMPPAFAYTTDRKKPAVFERKYILTQMPLEDTMEAFWQLQFEQHSTYILIYTPEQKNEKNEKNAPKPSDCVFWPEKEGEQKVFGKMTVLAKKSTLTSNWMQDEEPRMCWVELHVFLKGNNTGRIILIVHLPYAEPAPTRAWAHQQLVIGREIDHFDKDILCDSVVTVVDDSSQPSRAALFLAIDVLCEMVFLGRREEKTTVPAVVQWVRNCRPHAIKTADEYLIVIQALAEYIHYSAHDRNRNMRTDDAFKKICGADSTK